MTIGIAHPPCSLDLNGVHHPSQHGPYEARCPCGVVGLILDFATSPGHPLASRGKLFTSDSQMMSLIEAGMKVSDELQMAILARLRAADAS